MNKLNLDMINHIFSFIYEFSSDNDCNCYVMKKTHYHQISKYYDNVLPRKKQYTTPILYKRLVNYLGLVDNFCFCKKNMSLACSQIKRQVDCVLNRPEINRINVDDIHITVHCESEMLKQIYMILRKCKNIIRQYYCCGGYGIQFFVKNDLSTQNSYS